MFFSALLLIVARFLDSMQSLSVSREGNNIRWNKWWIMYWCISTLFWLVPWPFAVWKFTWKSIAIEWPLNLFPFPLNYFPSYSSLFQFLIIAFQLCGESPESLQIYFPAWFAPTPRQLSKLPVIQIRQEMSDGGSNPNRFTGYGWMKRKAAEEWNLPEGCPWSKKVNVSFWKLAKWLWHWALSLWPSVVSLSVRSATIFPHQPWY